MILSKDNIRESCEFLFNAYEKKLSLVFYKENEECIVEEINKNDNDLKPNQYMLFTENLDSRYDFIVETVRILRDMDVYKLLYKSIEDNTFCSSCHKLIVAKDNECPYCKNKTFIFGKHLIIKDNEIVCDCGSTSATRCFHTSFKGYGVTNYRCENCREISGREEHFESYADDEDYGYY